MKNREFPRSLSVRGRSDFARSFPALRGRGDEGGPALPRVPRGGARLHEDLQMRSQYILSYTWNVGLRPEFERDSEL